jgi:hypothetical protein
MHATVCTIERGEDQIDIDVEYSLTRFYPARTYGPPEDCYPAEGGEIEELTAYLDGKVFALTPAETQDVERQIYDNHSF